MNVRKTCSLALILVLAVVLTLSFMIKPAHADLAKSTLLKVVPASEIRGEHYHVYYGPQYKYVIKDLMDVTEVAGRDGLVYKPNEEGSEDYDIFIEPDDHYLITSARIICGYVDYYSRGVYLDETDIIEIDNPKLLIIRGREMGFTDGKGTAHIEAGGSPINNIPRNYTGPAYFSELDQHGQSFFTIEIATEMENSGAFQIEEASTGTRLEPHYTIRAAGSEMKGTARSVNEQFAEKIVRGDIKPGDHVEVQYDISKVGFILVRKGSSGYDDPKEPDWIVKDDTISFELDSDNRAMRVMYIASPGPVKLVESPNPLGFSTQIEISHIKNVITQEREYFEGDIAAVNAKLAEWRYNVDVWNDDEIFFRLLNPEHIDSVTMASKRINHGREEAMSPFGDNVLKGSGWSITLTNQYAYEFQINYHKLPGKVYITETAPNQGKYVVAVSTGPNRIVYPETTAAQSCFYVNNDIETGLFTIRVGSIVSVTFPENATDVRVAFGSKPSQSITKQLVNRTYTYTESAEDAHFYVVFKNSGGEIIINPTVPIDPDIPPFDARIFGGGDTGTAWTNPSVTGGTRCTCPTCTWLASRYPRFSSGVLIKPDWSVQVSTTPIRDYEVDDDTTVLAADEVYTFTTDTDVKVTITPVTNYPVNVKISYTVNGKTYDFSVSETTGTITATVCGEVSIDVEMSQSGFTAQVPTGYVVHMPKPDGGTAIRDHNLAVPGDTVTVAVKPDNGKTVEAVQVLTASGVSVPIQYLGHSSANYMVFTFTMPEDDVFIAVTYAATDA